MGRPLKKSFFGLDSGVGKQLIVSADVGDGAEQCIIVKQKGSKRFVCESIANPGTKMLCHLVDVAPAAPGEMTIAIDGQNDAMVKKITARKVVGFNGTVYIWRDLMNAQKRSQDPTFVDYTSGNEGQVGGDDPDVVDDTPWEAPSTATGDVVLDGDAVDEITITDGGFGYSEAPIVTILGDGDDATAVATIVGGVVTEVTITNPGSGYSAATVTFSAP